MVESLHMKAPRGEHPTHGPGSSALPRIALTMGDPAGIGPEIVLKALKDPHVLKESRLLVVGHRDWLAETAHSLGLVASFSRLHTVRPKGENRLHKIPSPALWHEGETRLRGIRVGETSASAGKASLTYVRRAARLALSGQVDAVVTAPIHKVSWDLAGIDCPGHTEFLADLCQARDYMMAFFIRQGWIGLVTTHLPLSKVSGAISTQAVLSKLRLLDGCLRDLGQKDSSIGVCALNPHSGESGLLGPEEERKILPAVRQATREGISVQGPFPADALFARPRRFPAILAMYHDQGLIAAKVLGRGKAVNVTLGLPFVRTSPAHGTAFDITGQGKADPEGLIAALRLASRLTLRRARHLRREKGPSVRP